MKTQLLRNLVSLCSRARATVAALAVVLAAIVVVTPLAQAQTYIFTGGADGAYPRAGITMDVAGNLYGTAFGGGISSCTSPDGVIGCGTVYKLSAHGQFSLLYSFRGGDDGYAPWGRVTIGPDGNLYGTTTTGGAGAGCGSNGCGTVFRLVSGPSICAATLCPWREEIIHRFAQSEGSSPMGDLIFDHAGNIYGVTYLGSQQGGCCGIVYKLSPSGSAWIFSLVHRFNGNDGASPQSGVTFDASGNLYGTTMQGGTNNNSGVVYQMTPSGSGWNVNVLYNFGGAQDLYSSYPLAGVTLDPSGNVYGSTTWGGSGGGGILWELAAGTWGFTLLYSGNQCAGPYAQMTWGPDGNLYGTAGCGPTWWHAYGLIFELSRNGGGWNYGILYEFSGGPDGNFPFGLVVFDANGIMHGTTEEGGGGNCQGGCGVVWAMAP